MEITVYVVVAVLLSLSVFSSKLSDRFGIPAILLFLILGMLAGSEGIGGIHFDDPNLAQTLSIFAFVLILFSGGFHTKWKDSRPVMIESFSLATVGVLLTCSDCGLVCLARLGVDLA